MTVEEATDRLLQTYSVYGVGREFLTGLMEDGIQNYNLSVEAVFHGTRMMLGQQLGVQELFSVRDVAAMLGTSETEALAEIEKAKAQLMNSSMRKKQLKTFGSAALVSKALLKWKQTNRKRQIKNLLSL